jgi:hypothetical protein
MNVSRLKYAASAIIAGVLLIAGSCYVTWKIARRETLTTFSERDYPPRKFAHSRLSGWLKTESESNSDSIRYQFGFGPASPDEKKAFEEVVSSRLGQLGLKLSLLLQVLQDSSGFTLCQQELSGLKGEFTLKSDDNDEPIGLDSHGDFYCPRDRYSKVTKWSIQGNYDAVVEAVRSKASQEPTTTTP